MSFAHSLLPKAGLALALLAAGAALAPAASAQNVLGNPGFETGSLSPWQQGVSFSGGELWHVTSDSPHSGTFAATCTGNQQIVQTFAPVAASSITEFSFWEKQDSSGSYVALDFQDGTSNGTVIFPTTEYTFFDLTSLATPGEFVTGVEFFGSGGGDDDSQPRTYLDDVTLTAAAVPEASTTASFGLLLALGVGGVIVAARRRKAGSAA